MDKVDLDYVQARVDKAGDVRHGFVLLPIEDAQDMVAELRAAREVIEATRRQGGSGAYQATVWSAVVAYDEAVASPPTTPTRRP